MPKRAGRPLKLPKASGRVPLSMRVTPAVRKKLERSAAKKGRSISQEAEIRLEQSFDREGHLILSYGDRWAYVLFSKGDLWIVLGHDPRDPLRGRDPSVLDLDAFKAFRDDHVVVLSTEVPEDLLRLRNFLAGAGYPWDTSHEAIEGVVQQWMELQMDIKRGK